MEKKVFLVGFMGSGKTTIGRLLAKKLKVPFVDIDEEIEIREGLKIPEIFALKGENYFRKLELEVLKEITLSLPSFVMATGGGLGANPRAMEFMKKHGTVVWLDIDFDTFLRRTSKDPNRPLLKRGEEKLKKLFEERKKVYSLADIKVKSQKSVELTLKKLLEELEKSTS
ncbi:MAG: shikimate kinase [Aquificae bacterium]|jgi:shikimate kinase|nr:shikimate kinase [Aquificota bacterium]